MSAISWLMRDRCSPALAELLLRALRQYGQVLLYFASLFGAGAMTSLRFIFLSWLVQAGVSGDRANLPWLLVATVAAWIGSQLGEFLANQVGLLFERSVGVQVIRAKVEQLLDAAAGSIRHLDANHAVHLLRNGLVVVARTLRAALNSINRLVLIGVTIGTAFALQPVLAAVCLLAAVVMLGWTSRHLRQQRQGATAALQGQQELHTRLCRLFTALPQVKLYGAGDEQLRRVTQPVQRQIGGEQVSLHAQRLATFEMNVAGALTGLLLLGLGGWLLARGDTTVADLTTLLVLHQTIFNGLRQVLNLWSLAEENSEYLAQLQAPTAADDARRDTGKRLEGGIETIVCEEASFAIGELTLLQGVTCELKRGRLYGIAGPSGSGKTMLLHLLSGHSLPRTGRLTVNQIPLDELRSEDLRSRVALATWPPLLITGTLEENLRVARPQAAAEDIDEALRKAALDKDVVQLAAAGGLAARIGQKGVQLSVGQLQRLALARAFLRQPEVLLLDDLLTGLDPETGERVLHALREFSRDRLVVFVIPHERALHACDELLLTRDGRLLKQTTPATAFNDPSLAEILTCKRRAA